MHQDNDRGSTLNVLHHTWHAEHPAVPLVPEISDVYASEGTNVRAPIAHSKARTAAENTVLAQDALQSERMSQNPTGTAPVSGDDAMSRASAHDILVPMQGVDETGRARGRSQNMNERAVQSDNTARPEDDRRGVQERSYFATTATTATPLRALTRPVSAWERSVDRDAEEDFTRMEQYARTFGHDRPASAPRLHMGE